MEWTTEFINNLPDECFAFVEPGGKKDESGKTIPRELRHFPYKGMDGKIDLPHLRNALAMISESPFGEKSRQKLEDAAKQEEVGEFKESLQEITESISYAGGKVDKLGKVIHDVVFLSSVSKNTNKAGKQRKYAESALNEALKYFDGAPVFADDHDPKKRTRNLAGELRNVRREGDKNFADLHVTENHSWLLDVAERFPRQIGLSIMATGKVKESDSGDVVEGFLEGARRSVDLVTEPATVKNLFESKQEEENKVTLEQLQEQVKQLTEQNTRLNEQVKLLSEKKQEAKPESKPEAAPEKRVSLEEALVRMENKLAEQQKLVEAMASEKAVVEKRSKIEKLIRENNCPSSDAFFNCLMRCEKDEEIMALVEDRKRAFSRPSLRSVGASSLLNESRPKEKEQELENKILESLGK